MSIIIGLTGGIATGKSTISNLFKEIGILVIDADVLAREVCEINEPAYIKIVETFGKTILLENGALNRKKLGHIVFQDEEKIQMLNSIIHPEVKRATMALIEMNRERAMIVLDVPLLFESHFDTLCDVTLVVYTDLETQITRLMNRDHLTKSDALLRINAQMSLPEKRKRATYTIDNSGSIENTRAQFDTLIKKLHKK